MNNSPNEWDRKRFEIPRCSSIDLANWIELIFLFERDENFLLLENNYRTQRHFSRILKL
jgi:hypothetical protein